MFVYFIQNKQDITTAAVAVLQKMFPNVTVPQPLDVFVPRWHADRYFLGSFSLPKVGAVDSDFEGLFSTSVCFVICFDMHVFAPSAIA